MGLQVESTGLSGVFVITPEVHEDSRGNFYETYNEKAYFEAGLTAKMVQDDVSVSWKGVLKGMHGDCGTYKLVQCVQGEVYSVILNCDKSSDDFGKWEAFTLSAQNKKQIYIPPMYGNGYFVLSEWAVYTYKQSTYYGDFCQFTYKWDDPRFGIVWPDTAKIMSERDA